MNGPRVVAVGGGRGLSATLRAVRQYAGHVTALVATADDSGSTGRLRRGTSLPAPGDLRRCLCAIAGAEDHPLGRALEYRFGGTDLEGHALGNLLLTGLAMVTGDFLAATDEVARLLGVDPTAGRVVPATVQPVELRAAVADGTEVVGQYAISKTEGVRRVSLDPPGTSAPPGVAGLILDADQIVLGPGSVYTSVLAAAMVDEVRTAIGASRARRIYVCNLEPEPGETTGYDVGAHVDALRAHGITPDVVVVDHGMPRGDVDVEVVEAALAGPDGAHDPAALSAVLARLVPVGQIALR